jgi:hypothetical protein
MTQLGDIKLQIKVEVPEVLCNSDLIKNNLSSVIIHFKFKILKITAAKEF